MIKENRVYKAKKGECYFKVLKIDHGIKAEVLKVLNGKLTSTDIIFSNEENFKKAVLSKPVRIKNYVEIDGEKVYDKDSLVFYSYAVIEIKKDRQIIVKSLNYDTANNSMSRVLSFETNTLGYSDIFFEYKVTKMKHELAQ